MEHMAMHTANENHRGPELKTKHCPICQTSVKDLLLKMEQVPVHCNILCQTAEEAKQAPRGDIHLGYCGNCTHIFNLAFDPDLLTYDQSYENSLHYSPRFQNYAQALAERLIRQYGVRGKKIIEIGCGKGDFLSLICGLGNNTGIGFDPSYVPERVNQEGVTYIQDFYSNRYSHLVGDLICCRHVLEHIRSPHDLLKSIFDNLHDKPDTLVFFEVPNAMHTLRGLGIWDVIYEHFSYFNKTSLAFLFTSVGFSIAQLNAAFDNQFLCVEAQRPANPSVFLEKFDESTLVIDHVAAFRTLFDHTLDRWRQTMADFKKAGSKIVIWGGGSKGVSFLNAVQADHISHVVDINPNKHGKYVPGTGQQIVPPEFLTEYQPDAILVMNSIYVQEIREMTKRLGVNSRLVVV